MHEHAHYFQLLAQPADVSPAAQVFEPIHPAGSPGAHEQPSAVDRERIRLCVRLRLAKLSTIDPAAAVVTIDVAFVVAGGVEKAVVDAQRFDAFAGRAAVGP